MLRPGGRAAISVWGPRERNPWLGIVFDAVSEQVGVPIPPPGLPGPFSLDNARPRSRGCSAPAPHRGGATCRCTRTPSRTGPRACGALAGPLATLLAAMPDQAAALLRERFEKAAQPYVTDTGLDFPGVALLATIRA